MKKYKSKIDTYVLKKIKSDIVKCKLKTPEDAYKYSLDFFHDDINIYESFFCIFLNRANNTIGYVKISQGGVTGTIVDPRLVFKYAVDSLSSAVILIHNHPSGDVEPSIEDRKITTKIQGALSNFDICLIDHIIISESGYYSFSDHGHI